MKSLDLGQFTRTGKDIEEFALNLMSFYFCVRIIGNQILGIKDAKKLLRAINSATSSKLSLNFIDEKVINRLHSGQINQITGIFNGVTITADENTTVTNIVTIYKQVDDFRRKITNN
jgi:hypothetical protein